MAPIHYLHRLPNWMPMGGITFYRHVWLKDGQRDRASIDHELVHVEQQLAHPAWFWLAYLLLLPLGWNPYRARWEAEAYRKQLSHVSPENRAFYLTSYARTLSGGTYLWCCRLKRARKLLED
jgi:hypothetical protein